jgi:hypothetical protein
MLLSLKKESIPLPAFQFVRGNARHSFHELLMIVLGTMAFPEISNNPMHVI